ncbi:hypothetical protein [Devosia sp. CN2-171]|uniref:hypothetical protein n=1 Tax=Devosia sp. CN2-171 TaxID=3400909 RepID=UPI003BF8BF31
MKSIDTPTALFLTEQPSLLSRARRWLADWLAEICASDEAPADPTAQFTSRDWADLPTHHPEVDE